MGEAARKHAGAPAPWFFPSPVTPRPRRAAGARAARPDRAPRRARAAAPAGSPRAPGGTGRALRRVRSTGDARGAVRRGRRPTRGAHAARPAPGASAASTPRCAMRCRWSITRVGIPGEGTTVRRDLRPVAEAAAGPDARKMPCRGIGPWLIPGYLQKAGQPARRRSAAVKADRSVPGQFSNSGKALLFRNARRFKTATYPLYPRSLLKYSALRL